MINILCFGDSITQGQADNEAGGWADRLKRDYFARCEYKPYQEIHLFNLGIGGENSDGLKRRFESEFQTRFIKGQTHLVILQYGANDVVIHKDKNRVPETYFIRNLSHCIELAINANAKVLLLNTLPIPDEFDGLVNQHGEVRKNSDLQRFNHVLNDLSIKYDCSYLDLYGEFSRDIKRFLAPDGLHPNSEGHHILFRLIKDKIDTIVAM